MRLPRKGVLIRILIYGILLVIFLPPAVKRFFAEREAKEQVEKPAEPDLEGLDKKTIVGPDGKKMEYFELTPEEFEQRFGRPAPEQGPAFEPQKPIDPGEKAELEAKQDPAQPNGVDEKPADAKPDEKPAADSKTELEPVPALAGDTKPDPVEAPGG